MMKRFKSINGRYIEKIYGQERFAYSHSDTEDIYDLIEWAKRGGYQGSELLIYDYETGDVFKPFEKQRDVLYSRVEYVDGYLYFLQGDYANKILNLYRYLPRKEITLITTLNLDEMELENLQIIGNHPYIISQSEERGFRCYYPRQLSFALEPEESVQWIEDGKIYVEAWIEEGWDSENNCATDSYQYYNRIIIKDDMGNTISTEIGCMTRAGDGAWWLS